MFPPRVNNKSNENPLHPGGARPNCYNFIELVTGCSFSTIGKVNEQMRKSGGSREPPAHGMCRYWEKHSTKKRPHTEEEEGEEDGESREYQQDNSKCRLLSYLFVLHLEAWELVQSVFKFSV